MRRRSGRESGQAAVETAITMPLSLFVILGTVQLFAMLNGRIMAEYGAFRAARAGSVNLADCRSMTHAALAAVMPAIAKTTSASELAMAFAMRQFNMYIPGVDGTRFGAIVWLVKSFDRTINGNQIVDYFDDRTDNQSRAELKVDMVFWFPMKIPFANWVIARSYLAAIGALPYMAANPLNPANKALWMKEGNSPFSNKVQQEMMMRTMMGGYDFPIRASARLRMMTPAMERGQKCPNSPTSL